MAYLVENQGLYLAIKKEVDPLVAIAQSPNALSDCLDRCPILTAVYQETLRVVTSSVSARNIIAPLDLSGTILQPGNMVLIPYRQILLNEEVFGSNAADFDATRFLRNPSLAKNQSFRPFGSGTTHCPGRFLAQKEVLTFIGIVLSRFDIFKADQESTFPRLELKKPCLGIMAPVKGDDVEVTVVALRL
jgi:cytochrome P450